MKCDTETHSLQHILNRRGLAIACVNVNSLLTHIDQLRVSLSIHKIDILTVNETKLDFSISSNEIHISGYDLVRRDCCHNGRHFYQKQPKF